ncbi:MAG: holo-ACP synthase [Methanothrix sp.]|nr:holo-ACP synthase [Methanothrix sp.]
MAILRTGIDLVEIERLSGLRLEIRQRFLERVFTPRELEQAGGSDASLAGRFAVKEAVAKVLGTGIGVLGWKQIEVERGPQGNPVLHLYGNAQAEAEKQGLTTWSISISHTRTCAVAVAVAFAQDAA